MTHRLPVIEGFVAVRYVVPYGSAESCRQQQFQGNGGGWCPHMMRLTGLEVILAGEKMEAQA